MTEMSPIEKLAAFYPEVAELRAERDALRDRMAEVAELLAERDRLRLVAQAAEKASLTIERVLNADASEGTPIWEWTEHEADMGVREVLAAGDELTTALDTLEQP